MRVQVISDMEGVSGIVKGEQTTVGEALYEEGRKLYTHVINAAVRGAKAGGGAYSEERELLCANLTTDAVKRGIGVLPAPMNPPIRARELIEDGAKRALSDLKAVAPYDPGTPCEIKVEYKNTAAPDKLRF